jgi:hypothetical protein
MIKKIYSVLLILLSALFIIGGCSTEEMPVVPVTGEVFLNGTPVENALVSFVPKSSGGRGASAMTEQNGSFILATQGATKNGAMPGEYIVLVSKWVATDNSGREIPPAPPKKYNPNETKTLEKQPVMKNLLPVKYEKKEITDLVVTVEKKKNHFKLDLKE